MKTLLTRNDTPVKLADLKKLVDKYSTEDWEFERMGWSQFYHDVQATMILVETLSLCEAIAIDRAPDGAMWYVEGVA